MVDPEETVTIEMTQQQRGLVLSALYDKLLDSRRYMSGAQPAETPGPMDSCCEGHLDRYYQLKGTYNMLRIQKEAVDATIQLFLPEGEK